jgi:hypothetical protein
MPTCRKLIDRVDAYCPAMVSLKQVISDHKIIRIGAMEIRDELRLESQAVCFQLLHQSCLTAGNSRKGGAISAVYLI